MKKLFLFTLVFFLVIALILIAKPKKSSSEIIKIGFIGPLSGFGAAWGGEQRDAAEVAVNEINETGGVSGSKFQIIYEDGACDGKEAAGAAQKLVSIDKVEFLLTVCSAETLSVAPIAEEHNVIQIGVWSTNPQITGIGQYVFRNSYSDEAISRTLAEIMNKKYRKVAVITELTDYPVGLRDAFKKYFQGEIVEEGYPANSEDVRTQVTKVFAQKPEVIFVNPNTVQSGLSTLRQVNTLGFKGGLYGNFFGSSPEVVKAQEAQGMVFISDPDVPANDLKQKLWEKFQAKHGKTPDFEFAVGVTYDAVYMLKGAIEKAGIDTNAIKDYLHDLKDFNGVMGTYGFDEKGDAIGVLPSIKQIRNYTAVPY